MAAFNIPSVESCRIGHLCSLYKIEQDIVQFLVSQDMDIFMTSIQPRIKTGALRKRFPAGTAVAAGMRYLQNTKNPMPAALNLPARFIDRRNFEPNHSAAPGRIPGIPFKGQFAGRTIRTGVTPFHGMYSQLVRYFFLRISSG